MARSRRKRAVSAPRRRRRSHRRRSRKAAAPFIMHNPRRRRRHRSNPRRHRRARHYRRNPGLPSTGFIMDAVYVTGGFFATRIAAGFVMPMLGTFGSTDLVRIAAKGGVSWGLGFLGGKFLGQRAGQLVMLGGLVETLSDAVKTYVSPFVPALSDAGSYPMISSYPALSMDGSYSNPYNVSMGYDEAL